MYPNLGIVDAYAAARVGGRIYSTSSRRARRAQLDQKVGGYQIDVVEPLSKLRLQCSSPDGSLDFDLRWTGSFDAVQEDPHLLLGGNNRPVLDASRFSQLGSWNGELRIAGRSYTVSDDKWSGARDRSWGIRPVGESEPAGRPPDDPDFGFWWVYMPLRFESCSLILIIQESPDGYRTLNTAKRVWPDGGSSSWAGRGSRSATSQVPGTRRGQARADRPDRSTGQPGGRNADLDPLHVGAGYNGDPDWSHGRWMGRDWSAAHVYDLTDPAVAVRVPYGVIDHMARAVLDGEEGWDVRDASIGRHDPSGFADFGAVAG